MRKTLLIVLVVVFVAHQLGQWFVSPSYIIFLEEHRKSPWAVNLLYKTGQYWMLMQNYLRAQVFFERCAKEEFKKNAEWPLCLYHKALIKDMRQNRWEAIQDYDAFIQAYPNHEKTAIAQRRMEILREGWSKL